MNTRDALTGSATAPPRAPADGWVSCDAGAGAPMLRVSIFSEYPWAGTP